MEDEEQSKDKCSAPSPCLRAEWPFTPNPSLPKNHYLLVVDQCLADRQLMHGFYILLAMADVHGPLLDYSLCIPLS